MSLTVTILTPERCLINGAPCHEVELPGLRGRFGVLADHSHMLAPLTTGEIRLLEADGSVARHFAIAGGFADINPERVLVTSHAAEAAETIDVARAQAARERAESRLQKPGPDIDVVRAQAALARALNRLQLAESAATVKA
jgi:F-type H+-transporting ATPase subunit epsilon